LETAPQNWEEIMRSAHEIFEDAMYQVYGQTEILPVAMMGTRPQFAKDVAGREQQAGDIGRLDANDCLRLDRVDDMMIRNEVRHRAW
jgi:hypothetical protein